MFKFRAAALVCLAGASLAMGCQGGSAFCLNDSDCGAGACGADHMCAPAREDAPARQNNQATEDVSGRNTITRSDGRTVWALELENGFLRGNLGDVRDYDEDANTMVGEYDGTYTTVTLLSERGDEAMMSILRVRGELGSMNLEKGRPTDIPGNMGTVVGCSGDPSDGWDFDEPADDVTITVDEPEAGRLRYTVTATFGEDQLTSTFDEVAVVE